MSKIHPTATVDPAAQVADDAELGPGVVIDGPVRIGRRVRIIAQAHVTGHTEIGDDCVIHPFAAIGGPPQDYAYKGQRSYCRVGPRTILREGVTIHCGTMPESLTEVGADCMLMANSHVAHNCRVADRVVLVNGVLLGGHVQVGHHAFLGGSAMAHQFVRIGEYAMIGGGAIIVQDCPPFMTVIDRGNCIGLNRVGLRRNQVPQEDINELRRLHRELLCSGVPIQSAARAAAERVQTPSGRRLIEFLLSESRRGFVGGPQRQALSTDPVLAAEDA